MYDIYINVDVVAYEGHKERDNVELIVLLVILCFLTCSGCQ